MSVSAVGTARFSVVLGTASAGTIDVGLPLLGGEPVEDLFGTVRPAGRFGHLILGKASDWLLGSGQLPVADDLEAATHRLYLDILAATRGRHLVRIWNYVPVINETGPDNLENYRAFCRGRSLAFEKCHGPDFRLQVPAASAVGCQHDVLSVVFAACRERPRHLENPRQIPAYHYPREYGPRSPSFARATVAPGPDQNIVFISGTAAVRGHTTVAPEHTKEQLACTLENLQEISLACSLGPDLGARTAATRHFKVYIRHPEDYPAIAAALDGRLFQNGDTVTYLQASICRRQLNVEIEAAILIPSGS